MAAIREVVASDYERLALFLKNHGRRKKSPQEWLSRFLGWWEANPAFSESKTPRGWILLVADSIKGFIGVIPVEMWVNGEIKILLSITTWRVSDDHRINSLGLIQKIIEVGNRHILICTTPNDRVQALLAKMHFSPLHEEQQSFANIYSGQLARAFVRVRSVLRIDDKLPLTKIISFTSCFRTSAASVLKRTDGGEFSIREISSPESEFEDLWLRTRSQYQMTQARHLPYIKWQLSFSNLDQRILLGCYRATQLVGFMFLRPLKKNRDLYYECIDLWCEPDALRIQSALLRGALRVAREKGALGVRFPIVSPEIGCLVRTYRGATIGKYPNIEKIKFPPINGIVSSSDANTFGYFTRMTGEYGL